MAMTAATPTRRTDERRLVPAPTSPQPSPSPASGGGAFDPAIPRRIRAGDEQAFARFYGDWFAPTLSLARAVSR